MRDRAPISSMNQHFHCQRCQQPLDLNERDFLSEDTDPLISAYQQQQATSQSQIDQEESSRNATRRSSLNETSTSPNLTPNSLRRASNTRGALQTVSRRTVHPARQSAQPGQDPHLFLNASLTDPPPNVFPSAEIMDQSYIVLQSQDSGRPRSAGERLFKARPSLDQIPENTEGTQSVSTSKLSIKNEDEGLLSRKIRMAGRFFDLMTAYSDLDHPLCDECASTVTEMLNQKLEEAVKEKSIVEEALESEEWANLSPEQLAALQTEITALKEEEEQLQADLKHAETQYKELQNEWVALDKENQELDYLEQAFWQECNVFAYTYLNLQDQQDGLQRQVDVYSAQLEKLRKTNVYNDAFHIWHDGPFGTINGLRLGRTSETPVEWSEINSAWGQALLLLFIMAENLNFKFKTYKLIPLGSFSRIERIEGDKASYEMYGSGDIQLSRLLWNRRFDSALTAFLNCIQQLSDFAVSKDPSFKLPYAINKDKIGDISIRTQFNQDEQWTKACKFTLTNLKWLLAFTCKQQQQQQPASGS